MKDIPETIQHLIDGELDDAGRLRLLRHLDEEAPERWRDLALGFLEARLLADALRTGRERQVAEASSVPTSRRRLWGLAAALVLGLGFGLLVSPAPRTSPEVVENPGRRSPDLPRYGTMNIGTTRDGGVEIPVFDATGDSGDASRAFHVASEPMRRIGAAYTEQGLQPELSTAYISADLENGKRLVVPVNYLAIPRTTNRERRSED